jgi:glycosyltransferase involved in cell wall biosynthesis
MQNQQSKSVALLIPCFNGLHFLPELLQQLEDAEEYFDEIILYDDASTEPFPFDPEQKFPQIQFHRSPVNKGAAHARNQLLKLASCDYVHFHDIDDPYIPKNFLSDLKPHLQENIVAFSSWETHWNNPKHEITKFDYPNFEQIQDFCEFLINSHIHLNAAIYPRQLALAAQFNEELRLMQDLLFNLKLACLGATFVHEEKVVTKHIKNQNSTLGKTQLKTLFQYRILYCQACKEVLPIQYYPAMGRATLYYAWDACLKNLDDEYKKLIHVAKEFGELEYQQFGSVVSLLAPYLGLDITFHLRRWWFTMSSKQ